MKKLIKKDHLAYIPSPSAATIKKIGLSLEQAKEFAARLREALGIEPVFFAPTQAANSGLR